MTEAQSIAADLKSDGQAMTLTRTTPGTCDPVTGSIGTPVVQTWTVYGITGNFKRDMNTANEPNSLILGGDKKAVINAGTVAPLPGDILTVAGVDYTIVAFDELAPQGEALLYTLQIRK